ncbi:MAG: phosphoribosylanthranilate isomerase [Pseudomonadota bacterium]
MWIKICGLTDETGVKAALDARADAIGFVFFPPSPRHIEFDRAAMLAEPARGKAESVALTVDADDTLLDRLVATVKPDILQLHGTEPPARVSEVKARYSLPVMKALPVADATDLAAIELYRTAADRILFDAKPPKDATRPGGNGEAFDWSLLGEVDETLDYVLSGGLNLENIGEALKSADAANRPPWGVDVSSGVERAPGIKDPKRVAGFVEAVRKAATDGTDKLMAAQPA